MRVDNILIPILKELKANNKELAKVSRFVKNCKAFNGNRRKAYKLIVRYKKNGGDK
jgi:hypothetical protein